MSRRRSITNLVSGLIQKDPRRFWSNNQICKTKPLSLVVRVLQAGPFTHGQQWTQFPIPIPTLIKGRTQSQETPGFSNRGNIGKGSSSPGPQCVIGGILLASASITCTTRRATALLPWHKWQLFFTHHGRSTTKDNEFEYLALFLPGFHHRTWICRSSRHTSAPEQLGFVLSKINCRHVRPVNVVSWPAKQSWLALQTTCPDFRTTGLCVNLMEDNSTREGLTSASQNQISWFVTAANWNFVVGFVGWHPNLWQWDSVSVDSRVPKEAVKYVCSTDMKCHRVSRKGKHMNRLWMRKCCSWLDQLRSVVVTVLVLEFCTCGQFEKCFLVAFWPFVKLE